MFGQKFRGFDSYTSGTMATQFIAIRPIFRFGFSISRVSFYIYAIIMCNVKLSCFCAAYLSLANSSCKNAKFDDVCVNVFESDQTNFNASLELAFNKYNRWPVNCG